MDTHGISMRVHYTIFSLRLRSNEGSAYFFSRFSLSMSCASSAWFFASFSFCQFIFNGIFK